MLGPAEYKDMKVFSGCAEVAYHVHPLSPTEGLKNAILCLGPGHKARCVPKARVRNPV